MGCDDCEATVRRVAGVVCVTDFAGRVAPFTQQAESVIGVDPGADPPEAWGQVRVAATGVQVGGEMVMTVDGDVLTATVAVDTQAAMAVGVEHTVVVAWIGSDGATRTVRRSLVVVESGEVRPT